MIYYIDVKKRQLLKYCLSIFNNINEIEVHGAHAHYSFIDPSGECTPELRLKGHQKEG